ncbi:FAD-dependent monooxygenase [Paraburkholderia acidisoli]|uniref:FAD-dependent oxidoreductase n=1 Tax=Paraburkholderia acidisoli TaxID=2571748 RepID=A0A7Z2GQU7_9BURK|nr:FAD-dependent monooxygenase [Paraburkholderia acidisoli]QGZ66070.1 FAD-dependent oxidoreductase [Paraburkholderia acidisoli]
MPAFPSSIHDVLIAGAGPVGLFLACELRLHGLSVLVLERAPDPHSPLKRLPFGMRGLNAPTLEALYRRGLLAELTAEQGTRDAAQPAAANAASAHWAQQPRRPAGHFAGIQFFHDDIDETRWPYRLPSPAGTSLPVALETLETVLARRAVALGAQILRGVSVDDCVGSADDVTVRAGAATFRARWLVGCDGGRSAVRKAAGFDFVGTEPELTGYSVDVELADPAALPAGRRYTPTGMYTYARPGTIAMVDFDGGACHRTALTLDHVQAVLRRVSGVEVTLTALRTGTTWTDRAMQASAYRRGRVLLAGDAAHVHSPLGGQGLNLGIGDAMNLGWKLAATLRGEASAGLLDSYHAERHAVGARVLDGSRAQIALMRPTPATRSLAAIVRDLLATRDGATYFAERVWGVGLRYDLNADDAGIDHADVHPLVGRSAPDFEFVDGTKLGTLLREGKGLLLDFEREASRDALASGWRDRVNYIAREAKDRLGLRALLIRPDGCVAWASDAAPGEAELTRALRRWFGTPGEIGESGGGPFAARRVIE